MNPPPTKTGGVGKIPKKTKLAIWTGGPFKPGFGLSGEVLQLAESSRRSFGFFVSSIPIRSLRLPQRQFHGVPSLKHKVPPLCRPPLSRWSVPVGMTELGIW